MSKGTFRPVPFGALVPKQGAFSHKNRFVRAYVNTSIVFGCRDKTRDLGSLPFELSLYSENITDMATKTTHGVKRQPKWKRRQSYQVTPKSEQNKRAIGLKAA